MMTSCIPVPGFIHTIVEHGRPPLLAWNGFHRHFNAEVGAMNAKVPRREIGNIDLGSYAWKTHFENDTWAVDTEYKC